jgi:hypothetical protein
MFEEATKNGIEEHRDAALGKFSFHMMNFETIQPSGAQY